MTDISCDSTVVYISTLWDLSEWDNGDIVSLIPRAENKDRCLSAWWIRPATVWFLRLEIAREFTKKDCNQLVTILFQDNGPFIHQHSQDDLIMNYSGNCSNDKSKPHSDGKKPCWRQISFYEILMHQRQPVRYPNEGVDSMCTSWCEDEQMVGWATVERRLHIMNEVK